MTPALKRFKANYGKVADAVARVDIDQEDREKLANALVNALRGERAFTHPELFWHLCADPLVACGGPDGQGCPYKREIRVAMHLSSEGDGRSKAWSRRLPRINCVSCGPVVA